MGCVGWDQLHVTKCSLLSGLACLTAIRGKGVLSLQDEYDYSGSSHSLLDIQIPGFQVQSMVKRQVVSAIPSRTAVLFCQDVKRRRYTGILPQPHVWHTCGTWSHAHLHQSSAKQVTTEGIRFRKPRTGALQAQSHTGQANICGSPKTQHV